MNRDHRRHRRPSKAEQRSLAAVRAGAVPFRAKDGIGALTLRRYVEREPDDIFENKKFLEIIEKSGAIPIFRPGMNLLGFNQAQTIFERLGGVEAYASLQSQKRCLSRDLSSHLGGITLGGVKNERKGRAYVRLALDKNTAQSTRLEQQFVMDSLNIGLSGPILPAVTILSTMSTQLANEVVTELREAKLWKETFTLGAAEVVPVLKQ